LTKTYRRQWLKALALVSDQKWLKALALVSDQKWLKALALVSDKDGLKRLCKRKPRQILAGFSYL
jgi:hypothetical protein